MNADVCVGASMGRSIGVRECGYEGWCGRGCRCTCGSE